MEKLTPAERLIVAADFEPVDGRRESVELQVLRLADDLRDTGVYLKVNSALAACGYRLIRRIHERGLRVFADPKLVDIDETLRLYGTLLRQDPPELLTTMCDNSIRALGKLKESVSEKTEVLGVTALTTMDESDTQELYSCSVEDAVLRRAARAHAAGFGGLICSARESTTLSSLYGQTMTINTPGIRPAWSVVAGDDQKRTMTPSDAIRSGSTRIIVGRPITQAANRLGAVRRILEEINQAQ